VQKGTAELSGSGKKNPAKKFDRGLCFLACLRGSSGPVIFTLYGRIKFYKLIVDLCPNNNMHITTLSQDLHAS
jgi:hypothetical protein